MKLKTYLSLMIFMVLGSWSCKKDTLTAQNHELSNVPTFSKQQKNRANTIFGQALAKALTNKIVRQYFKEKAAEKFDGDFDLLYSARKNDKILNGKTLSEVLFDYSKNVPNTKYSGNNTVNSVVDLAYFQDSISLINPTLNVCIPLIFNGGSDWNTNTVTPKIIVKTCEYDQNTQYVLAYDAFGNTYQVNIHTTPDELYLVVGASERLKSFPKSESATFEITKIPYYENNFFKIFFIDDLADFENERKFQAYVAPPPPVVADDPPVIVCQRDTRAYVTWEEISGVKFVNKQTLITSEPWIDGDVELVCYVAYVIWDAQGSPDINMAQFSNVKKVIIRHRDIFMDSWWTSNVTFWVHPSIETFKWDRNTSGYIAKCTWLEFDEKTTKTNLSLTVPAEFKKKATVNGVEVEQTIGITLGGTVEINPDDYPLGESLLDYCDRIHTYDDGTNTCYGELKNTGSLYFTTRSRYQ